MAFILKLLYIFWEFFQIGLFTFGGGFAMIPLVKETVLSNNWLTEADFYSFIGVCESTPGPIAINMATYVGASQAGPLGSVFATLGVVLPSFIIILLIAALLKGLTETKWFKGFLSGAQPVITALLLSTGLVMLAKALGYGGNFAFTPNYEGLVIFALLLAIVGAAKKFFKKKLSSIQLILISAVLGIAVCMIGEVLK
ncbi:MAG: chromate transporter [Clostridia bacterium]|nr:chromate transporter [Clostridia bacterium]